MDDLERRIVDAMRRDDWATVDQLAAKLHKLNTERLTRLETPQARLEAALWYAERGLHVFPLRPRSKVPHPGTSGSHDATSDLDRIRVWWRRWPDSNVAIATGHLVDVIDIDGPTGQRSRLDNWDEYSELEVLGVASTPRPGGMHLFIAAAGRPNGTALDPGIDYRGIGGYVVAPPSVRKDGQYTWLQPLTVKGVA